MSFFKVGIKKDKNIGMMLMIGEGLLTSLQGFWFVVIVDFTDVKKLGWIKITLEDGEFSYELHLEITTMHLSLCILLKNKPNELYVNLP